MHAACEPDRAHAATPSCKKKARAANQQRSFFQSDLPHMAVTVLEVVCKNIQDPCTVYLLYKNAACSQSHMMMTCSRALTQLLQVSAAICIQYTVNWCELINRSKLSNLRILRTLQPYIYNVLEMNLHVYF